MNIVNKLTLRQLLLNRKRTLVTIIGTIISAAMITAVATLGFSFMDLMQRQSIASNGEWHAVYSDVNVTQLRMMQANKKIKETIMKKELGYSSLEGSQNKNKPYLYITAYNKAGFENTPIQLTEGRVPETPEEIILSEEVLTNAKVKYKLGDKIDLAIGHRQSNLDESEVKDDTSTDIIPEEMNQSYGLQWKDDTIAEKLVPEVNRQYTIVGFIKRPNLEFGWAPGYSAYSYMDENTVASGETFQTLAIFKKVNGKIFDNARQIQKDCSISDVDFNNDLLRYYGVVADDQIRNMLYIITGIIMVIIMIGSISLIYNAFAISVSERSRYLGMLSSVGATKRQKRNSVFFEGAVIGAISIPLGITAGYIGLAITYIFINPLLKQALYVTVGFRLIVLPVSLFLAVLVSGATILISTYIPARRASNVSAIDAIRQSADVKISRKQVHTNILTRKIFGIEGDLGLKNLKRNRGRYKATIFSLIISMVLFLVVSYFTDMMKKTLVMTQDGINFDIQTTVTGNSDAKKDEIVKKLMSLDGYTNVARIDTVDTFTQLDKAAAADYLVDNHIAVMKDGKYSYQVIVNALDDNALQKYAKQTGIDFSRLTDPSNPSAIVIDTMRFKDYESDKYVETKVVNLKQGEELALTVTNSETKQNETMKPVKAAAFTDIMPMGIMTLGDTAGFHIIVSERVFREMCLSVSDKALWSRNTEVYYNSDNPLKLQDRIEAVQSSYGMSSVSVYNVFQFKQREHQALLLVSVFTYAFIILITAICVANIINTISTSIALRKREFAMLKSVGITPKGFNRMLNYESIFYGIKAIIYGIPVSIVVMYLLYLLMRQQFNYAFKIPVDSMFTAVASVFCIVGIAMLYSSRKVRKENIIDALKQEII